MRKSSLPTDPALLRGELAIFYKRWSDPIQKKGNSRKRQLSVEQRIIDQLGMKVDPQFDLTDDGLPASDGTNRKKGKLKDFLDIVGLTPEGERVVLSVKPTAYQQSRLTPGKRLPQRAIVVEAIDRLVREERLVSEKLLTGMISYGGLIIIDWDSDDEKPRIWDEAALNGPMAQLLTGLVQAAHNETKKLSARISPAFADKREQIEAFANVKSKGKIPPRLIKIPPWYSRKPRGEGDACKLETGPVKTVREVFALCLAGWTIVEIRDYLNAHIEKYPLLGRNQTKNRRDEFWSTWKVRNLLKDDRVLGFVTCKSGGPAEWKNKPTLVHVKALEAIISTSDFHRVQKIVSRAPYGRSRVVSNLFPGKLTCHECQTSLVILGAGRGMAHRYWGCRAHYERGNTACTNAATYPVRFYEPRLIHAMLMLSASVPRKHRGPTKTMLDKLAKLDKKIESKRRTIAELNHDQDDDWQQETHEQIRTHSTILSKELLPQRQHQAGEIASASESHSHEQNIFETIKTHLAAALADDVNARSTILNLLQPIDFGITTSEHGLVLTLDTHGEKRIEPGVVEQRVYLKTPEAKLWGRVKEHKGVEIVYRGDGWATQFPMDDLPDHGVAPWRGRSDKQCGVLSDEDREEWRDTRARYRSMSREERRLAKNEWHRNYQNKRNAAKRVR